MSNASHGAVVLGAGPGEPAVDWPQVARYRDRMNSGLDDSAKARAMRDAGVDVLRGHGRIARPGAVDIDRRILETRTAQRPVVAVGRNARVDDIGLEQVGIEPGPRGIEVDDHCRAADDVWAVGDVTGVSPFTHVAAYQAQIACADMPGDARIADYPAIPRVVFCDPGAAAVGRLAL